MSFALGQPLSVLRSQLSEADLKMYQIYANESGLPFLRAEIYQAQQAYITAVSMGGYKGKVSDFLLFQDSNHQNNHNYQDENDEDDENDEVFGNFRPLN